MATTFTVSAGSYCRPWKNVRVQHYPEDASQTFKRGEVLIKGGAGLENKVKIAANDPVAAIVGIAAADASGVTGAMVPVWLATDTAEFIAHTISTSAVDFTDIGTGRAIEKDGTNVIWVIDTADAGADGVVVLGYVNPITKTVQTVEGDTSALCVFRFNPGATIWAGVGV